MLSSPCTLQQLIKPPLTAACLNCYNSIKHGFVQYFATPTKREECVRISKTEIKQYLQRMILGIGISLSMLASPLCGEGPSDYCSQEALIANFPPTILQETL